MVVQPVQHDSHRWHPENLSATLIQGSMGKICQWTNLGTVYVHFNHCRKTCDFSWNASPVRTGRPHLERCVIASRNPKTSHRIHAAHSEKQQQHKHKRLMPRQAYSATVVRQLRQVHARPLPTPN